MAFHIVLTPPPADGASRTEQLEKVVFVKDGFSLFGFLFTGLWLLAKRLWLAFAVFALVWALIGFGGRAIGVHPLGLLLAQALIGLFIGLEGNAMIERKLLRKGWSFAGVVEGKDLDLVERRYFDTLEPAASTAAAPLPGVQRSPSAAPPQGVLGLFPEARGRA